MKMKSIATALAIGLALAGVAVVGVAEPVSAHGCTHGDDCTTADCPSDGKIHQHGVGCTSVPTLAV